MSQLCRQSCLRWMSSTSRNSSRSWLTSSTAVPLPMTRMPTGHDARQRSGCHDRPLGRGAGNDRPHDARRFRRPTSRRRPRSARPRTRRIAAPLAAGRGQPRPAGCSAVARSPARPHRRGGCGGAHGGSAGAHSGSLGRPGAPLRSQHSPAHRRRRRTRPRHHLAIGAWLGPDATHRRCPDDAGSARGAASE